uniref:Zinc finger CCCH domain-containing protein 10 n=2 Tax=Cacopsylla melanoneura TaxID=428564 RepID=A0A8D9FF32_9HEMI
MKKKKSRSRAKSAQQQPPLVAAPTNDNSNLEPDGNDRPSPGNPGICRDFLRNVCTRENCKFQHETVVGSVQFCHDFQNTRRCPRKHCKYTHGTYEDEQFYLTSGRLPDHLKPVCMNYLKNQCKRAQCKFLHPRVEPDGKSENSVLCLGQTPRQVRVSSTNQPPDDREEEEESLSQENEFLKMRLHELEQHLIELRSNNQFLMEENHRLKQERHHTTSLTTLSTLTGSSVVTALAVPNSTNMTLTMPPHSAGSRVVTALAVPNSTNMTLTMPHSAASVAALAMPHSATSVAALTVPAVTINTKQQVVGGATLVPVSIATMTTATPVSIATVTATPVSIATVTATPVSIATVTTGAPVSITTVSMPPSEHVIYPILTQVCSKMN